jgi:phospholipid N-methyltransferase
MFFIHPDWASFLLSFLLALVGLISWAVHKIKEQFDKEIKEVYQKIQILETNLKENYISADTKTLQEIKYNIKDKLQYLKNDIKNLYHLIENIEIRLTDRTQYAKIKWANIIEIINNIQNYLSMHHNYIIRNIPLTGVDATLSNDNIEQSPDTDIF